MRYDVITIGAATRDVFLIDEQFKVVKEKDFIGGEALCFNLGSKNELEQIFLSTGGGATNAAVTFARQGLKAGCVCRVGDEESGRDVARDLTKEGVSKEFIQRDKKAATAYSAILVTPRGERVVMVKRGASDHIKFSDIDLSKLKNVKWFYVSSLAGDIPLLKKILDFAERNKIKVALNPGGLELAAGLKKLESLLKKTHLFMVNREEAADLVGVPYGEESKIFNRLDSIIQDIVVMTDGPNGVIVSDGDYIYKAGVPKSAVVDRTGSGDAFGSGLVAGLMRGNDISRAIQLGTANATSVVAQYTAKAGILHKGKWGKWPKVQVQKSKLKN